MPSYLLLRDNKESGPFALDDLMSLGLKPYDLIWVQGKSAAWRYPSEIDELKPFAPAVEEQPFDRFYKKNAEEKKEEPPAIEEQYSRYIPAAAPEEETKYVPKRSVFVTLPGQKRVELKKETTPVPEKPVAAPRPNPVPLPEPTPAPTISITENPATAEIKYSQPLDEIKEMYVKTLLDRKDKKARKGLLLNAFKKAAVFGGLIILGVLAGFIIRSKPGSRDQDTQAVQKMMDVSTSAMVNKPVDDSAPAENAETNPEVTYQPAENKKDENKREKEISEPAPSNGEQPSVVKLRKETMMIVPKRKEDYDRKNIQGAEVNMLTGERERTLRMDREENTNTIPKTSTASLKDQVSVASNDYKIVAFGGIRNLYLTVTNHSKYELDHVIVELQYLKPSEEPLRTENINFKSIGPNASATIRVPDTNRGIKVNYRIINIASKQNDLASGN